MDFDAWFNGDGYKAKWTSAEILKVARREYYAVDAELRKMQAAIDSHPNRYIWTDSISPVLYYRVREYRARYETALQLYTLLEGKRAENPVENVIPEKPPTKKGKDGKLKS